MEHLEFQPRFNKSSKINLKSLMAVFSRKRRVTLFKVINTPLSVLPFDPGCSFFCLEHTFCRWAVLPLKWAFQWKCWRAEAEKLVLLKSCRVISGGICPFIKNPCSCDYIILFLQSWDADKFNSCFWKCYTRQQEDFSKESVSIEGDNPSAQMWASILTFLPHPELLLF